jgi:hypothetical protein
MACLTADTSGLCMAKATLGGRNFWLLRKLERSWPLRSPPSSTHPPIQANQHQWDFAENWMQHVANAGITYAVVAASDASTSRRLAALGQPCFEWIDDEIPGLGLNWGEEGWRRMTWSKVGTAWHSMAQRAMSRRQRAWQRQLRARQRPLACLASEAAPAPSGGQQGFLLCQRLPSGIPTNDTAGFHSGCGC